MEIVDVLIVGAGASGAAAAWSLSETSMDIMCLEQGGRMDSSDYPSTKRNWEVLRQNEYNVSPNVRKLAADYPINDSESPIAIANFNAVGGGTILYSGHFPRFHPSDFKARSLDGVADDWPVTYAQLEPFFVENDRMMGVSTGRRSSLSAYRTSLPRFRLVEWGETIGKGFNKLGWHWWPSYSAIITRQRGGREKCINLGPCNTGCAQGAKSSVDITYWPGALRNGVKLKTHCRVREITVNNSGRATGVIYYDERGVECTQRARIVILGATA